MYGLLFTMPMGALAVFVTVLVLLPIVVMVLLLLLFGGGGWWWMIFLRTPMTSVSALS